MRPRPLTHLPRQAVHCLLHLPQVRLSLLSTPCQALQRSPLHTFPLTLCLGKGYPVRPDRDGGQTDRLGTPVSEHVHTGHTQPGTATYTPGTQVLLGRAIRLSRDTSLRSRPGLALSNTPPTPAPPTNPSCPPGVSRDRDRKQMACPHLQEREYRAGPENLAPKPKAVHECS